MCSSRQKTAPRYDGRCLNLSDEQRKKFEADLKKTEQAGNQTVAAAFKESWRTPILLYSLLEKAFMVYLVFSNLRQPFAGGFLAPAIMDAAITAWSIVYFISLRRDGGVR